MSFLVIAVPVVIIVLLAVSLPVFFSDNNKHLRKLSNERQNELAMAKKQVMDEINKKKGQYETVDVQLTDEINSNRVLADKNFYKENYSKKIQKVKARTATFTVEENNAKKLVFTKENIVRGLIAKQYLDKK